MAHVLQLTLVELSFAVCLFGSTAYSGQEQVAKTSPTGSVSADIHPSITIQEGGRFSLVTRIFRGRAQWFKDGHSLELMRIQNYSKKKHAVLNLTTSWNETTGENTLRGYNVSSIHSGNYSCKRTHHYPDGVSQELWIIVKVQNKSNSLRLGMVASLPLVAPSLTLKLSTRDGDIVTLDDGIVSLDSVGARSYENFPNRSHTSLNTLPAGYQFKMHCQVEGHPDSPAVDWDKNGSNLSNWQTNRVRLQNDDSLLIIEKVQCEDAGIYTCTVNTSRGILYDRKELKVELGMNSNENIDKYDCQKDPEIHMTEYTAVGHELKLTCKQAPGHWDLRIGRRWQKRGRSRHPTCDNRKPYDYIDINKEWWLHNDTYVKNNVTREDAGVYLCIAKDLGRTSSSEPEPKPTVYCVVVQPFPEVPEVQPSIQIAEGPSVAWTAIASAIVLAVLLLALAGYLVYRRVKPYHDTITQSIPNEIPLVTTSTNPVYDLYPWLELRTSTPTPEIANRRAQEIHSGSHSPENAAQMEPLMNGEPSGSFLPSEADSLLRAQIKIGQLETIVTVDPNDRAFVPPNGLRLTRRLLGKGAFGEVWEGTLITDADTVRVAAKRLNEQCVAEENLHEIIQECRLMQSMAPHENVLRCLGFCITSKNLHLLTEFAANGNLKTYMKSHKDDVQHWNYERPLTMDFITAYDLSNFSWQIAKGMQYLAEIQIVHRDLAARNVLVNEQKILKIADFGLSRRLTSKNYYRIQKQTKMPMKWMAPESLTQRIFDSRSDVWSFGVVMWEIAAFGQDPYQQLFMEKHIIARTHQCMASVLLNNVRLPAPSHATPEMYSIMQSCWTYDAERRPTFHELERQLNALCNSDEQIHAYTMLSCSSGSQVEQQYSGTREAATS